MSAPVRWWRRFVLAAWLCQCACIGLFAGSVIAAWITPGYSLGYVVLGAVNLLWCRVLLLKGRQRLAECEILEKAGWK